jgi:polyisoprenoid-binding protein YceI
VSGPRPSEDRPGLHEHPEPGAWTIDPVHSFVTFRVWHQAVSYARGMAAGPTGIITITPDLLDSSVQASIDASSLTTLHPVRDAKVRGDEVLGTARFPSIDFVSTGLWSTGEHYYELGGQLSLHGMTRDISLDLAFNGVVEDNWGKRRLGVTAKAGLARDDFGVGSWGHVPLVVGGFMVPDRVDVTLDIEATKDVEPSEP